MMQMWLSLIPAILGHGLMIKFYHVFKKKFTAQYRLRELTPFLLSTVASIDNDNDEDKDKDKDELIETVSETKSMDFNDAYSAFVKGAAIPFICLSTITTLIDNLITGAGYLMCFPLGFFIFCVIRSLVLQSNGKSFGMRADIAVLLLLNAGLASQILLNETIITWDKWITMCLLCIFGSITMRYYGQIIIDLTQKEFKRKNLMMIERYKTETLFQKVLPPQITEQMRDNDNNNVNDDNEIIQNAIHDKNATVAFVKIFII